MRLNSERVSKKMKKITAFILVSVLCMGFAVPAFAAGGDVNSRSFTPESLTEYMLSTGSAIELVEINRLSDKAVSNGYNDAYDQLHTVNQMASNPIVAAALSAQGYKLDSFQEETAKIVRDYFKNNLDKNYEADLNNIRISAINGNTGFYTMLLVQEYSKIAQETLKIKENTLKTVEKRYKLGSASKMELLQAQMEHQSAKSDAATAANSYDTAVMNFNIQMGFPMMEKAVFEYNAELSPMPEISLEDAIKSAVQNRNDIGMVHFAYELQSKTWRHTQLTANSSSQEYLSTKAAYLSAAMNERMIASLIEMDIRSRYSALQSYYEAAQAARSTLELAQESYRITNVSYGLGASTLSDLQAAENMLNSAKLGLVDSVAKFNAAAAEFDIAIGVGTSRISLGA